MAIKTSVTIILMVILVYVDVFVEGQKDVGNSDNGKNINTNI